MKPLPLNREPAGVPGQRLVAIHQPNFLPWLGYFDKLARADVFILLDTVQFPKKAGSWMNRARLLVGGEPSWITVPVVRSYHGLRSTRAGAGDRKCYARLSRLTLVRSSLTTSCHSCASLSASRQTSS